MVPVRVLGLAVDARMQPVVLLTPLVHDRGPRTLVPIWVGAQEAASISIAVNGEEAPRPLSHDLMQRLLEAVDASVDRVAVTRIEEGTFYAELSLTTTAGRLTLDCRPSDAIALASRVGAPLFVAEAVLDDAGVLEEPEGTEEEPVEAEEEVAEFRRFLADVDPEDFQG
ncbi:bifunctional nuclease family protein [Amnibacterium sp. CER49]|uniref:bifunctional nuclease family protein n=1 Tax=Amnibacterium sp. CER49 TaxID=3039161 RepID=UPI00244A6133|nr:bifunctional nuclease family protein [Amnibacterium sp. CER49]MDH2443251.1 bifunctional nuclease family protein [Amnibacterium sp. CER49]